MERGPVDWAVLGERLARLRIRQGLSIRSLAMTAAVDKNTVLRLEKGLPIRPKNAYRICMALNTTVPRQLAPTAEPGETFRVSRAASRTWVRTKGKTLIKEAAGADPFLGSREARHRMGWNHVEAGFNALIDCQLFDGQIVSSFVELFGATEPQQHPGEEYLFCLTGRIVVHVGRQRVELRPGDAISFWPSEPHFFAPLTPVGPGENPPTFLSVRI